MPSLPTSLIVVGLVAAWLVVLVPMVAKRREHVPESDEDAAGFRVLRRVPRSLRRRRPVLSRTAVGAEGSGEPGDPLQDDVQDDLQDETGEDAEWDDDRWDESATVDELVGETVDGIVDGVGVVGGVDSGATRGADRTHAGSGDGIVAVDGSDAVVGGDGSYLTDREDEVTEYVAEDVAENVAENMESGAEEELDYSDEAIQDGERAPVLGRPRPAPVANDRQPMLDAAWGDDEVRHRPEVHDAAEEWAAEHRPGDRDSRRHPTASRRAAGSDRRRGPRPQWRTDPGRDGGPEIDGHERRADAGADLGNRAPHDDRWDSAPRRGADPEFVGGRRTVQSEVWSDGWSEGWDDEAQYRPVPVRPGRGGFDPQAAEQARAYRYRQRRRVVLALLLLTVIGAGLGVLGMALGWAGAVVAAVLLSLYLAYLRRQVRIEEAIRQRRAARLERARQIRPMYRASVAEQVHAHRSGSLPRPLAGDESARGYRVRSHARPTVPPTYHTRGVPVDLDDDDPAFDDLEYYRPVTYRRAVGE